MRRLPGLGVRDAGRRRSLRVAAIVLAVALVSLAAPDAARAQRPEVPTGMDEASPVESAGRRPTFLGLLVGYASSEGIWKPASESSRIGGALVGGFVDAATPVPWFDVHAEILWSQRGDDVTVTVGGVPATGGTRLDYLSIGLRPSVHVALGPIRLHTAAGPVVEQVVRSRLDPTLAPLLAAPATTFGVMIGAGVGTTIAGRRIDVEARHLEGLSDAVQGGFVSMRNRSFEVVARVGFSLPAR